MRLVIVLFAIFAGCLAHNDNRSPKMNGIADKGRAEIDFCAECKEVVVQIRTILEDPSKFEQLQTELRLLCGVMGPYSDMCQNIVNNLPFVIHQIRPLLQNETAFCTQAEFCGPSTVNTGAKKLVLLLIRKHLVEAVPTSVRHRPNNDIVCEECIFAVTELKSLLQDRGIQDQVKQFLESLCHKLSSMQQECTQILDEYLPLVFSELMALLENPRAVCTDAGLCTGRNAAHGSTFVTLIRRLTILRNSYRPHRNHERMSVHTAESNGIELPTLELLLRKTRTKGMYSVGCTMCEVTMRKIKEFLMNDESAQINVINKVKGLCNKMPEEVKVQCIDFLDVYGKASLIVMIDQMDPQKICRDLGACDSRESKRLQRLWKMNARERGDVECEACRIFVNVVRVELQDPQVQTEITQLFKRLCAMAPAAYVQECNDAVDAFVPALIANVGQLTPDTVCPAVDMCPSVGGDLDETIIELRA
jgi:hypothetical protein